MRFPKKDLESLLDYIQELQNINDDPALHVLPKVRLTEAKQLAELYGAEALLSDLRSTLEGHLTTSPSVEPLEGILHPSRMPQRIWERLMGFHKATREIYTLVQPGETVAAAIVVARAHSQFPGRHTDGAIRSALGRLAEAEALDRVARGVYHRPAF